MKRGLTARLATVAATAALAIGAVACEVDENGTVDDGVGDLEE